MPELSVTILELRDMKHDGSHSLIVRLGDSERRSDFIDGYGAFKVIKFTTNFPITHSDSLNSSFWSDRLLHVSVTHKRTFFNDKVVGCCAIPIVRARGAEYTAWYSLLHKGSPRGSVKYMQSEQVRAAMARTRRAESNAMALQAMMIERAPSEDGPTNAVPEASLMEQNDLRSQIGPLRVKVSELTAQQAVDADNIASLQDSLERLHRVAAEYRADRDELSVALCQRAEQAHASEAVETLTEQLGSTQRELQRKSDELTAVQLQLEHAQRNLRETTFRLEETMQALDDAQRQLADSNQQLEEAPQQSELDDAIRQLEDAHGKLIDWAAWAEQEQRDREQLTLQLDEMRSAETKLQSTLAQLEQCNLELAEAEEQATKRWELEAELAMVRERLRQAEEQCKASADAQKKLADTEMAEMRERLHQMQRADLELAALNERLAESEFAQTKLKKDLESELVQKGLELAEKEAELNICNTRLAESAHTDRDEELEAVRTELAIANAQLHSAELAVKEMEAVVVQSAESKVQLTDLLEDQTELKKTNATLRQKIDQLESVLLSETGGDAKMIPSLQLEIEELQLDKQDLTNKLGEWADWANEVQKELETKNEQLMKLEDELALKDVDGVEVVAHSEATQRELDMLRAELVQKDVLLREREEQASTELATLRGKLAEKDVTSRVSEMEALLSDKEKLLSESNEEIAYNNSLVETLTAQLEDNETAIRDATERLAEMDRLRAELAEKTLQLAEQTETEDHQSFSETLRVELVQKDALLKQQAVLLAERAMPNSADIQMELDTLRDELAEKDILLRDQAVLLAAQSATENQGSASTLMELDTLRTELATLQGQLDRKDAAEWETQTQMQSELNALRDELIEKEALLEQQAALLSAQSVTESQGSASTLMELDTLRTELATLQGQLDRKEAAEWEKQTQRQSELNALRDELIEKEALLEQQVALLSAQTVTEGQGSASTLMELETLRTELATLQGQLDRKDAAEWVTQTQRQSELNALRDELDAKNTLLKEQAALLAERDMIDRADELQTLRAELAEKDAQLDAVQVGAMSYDNQPDHQTEIESLRAELAQYRQNGQEGWQSERTDLETKLLDWAAWADAVADRDTQTARELQQAKDQIEALQEATADLSEQLVARERMSMSSPDALKLALEETEMLKEKVRELIEARDAVVPTTLPDEETQILISSYRKELDRLSYENAMLQSKSQNW